jgi:hypothetical protein
VRTATVLPKRLRAAYGDTVGASESICSRRRRAIGRPKMGVGVGAVWVAIQESQ